MSVFIKAVIASANDRGARGEVRTLNRLASEAIAPGIAEFPTPASLVSQLEKTPKDETEVSPLVFVYAFYLMFTYGYDATAARRLANRHRTELDGTFSENVAMTKAKIANLDDAFDAKKKDTEIEVAIKALSTRASSLVAKVKKGVTLSDDEVADIASVMDELRTLVSTTVAEEVLV